MNDRVSSIRNLGPKMEVALNAIGIYDAQTIRALGADESYQRLLNNGFSPHFIGYYALVMGLQNRPWNDCTATEKQTLRTRFDFIKIKAHFNQSAQDADFERIINEIGLHKKELKNSALFREQTRIAHKSAASTPINIRVV